MRRNSNISQQPELEAVLPLWPISATSKRSCIRPARKRWHPSWPISDATKVDRAGGRGVRDQQLLPGNIKRLVDRYFALRVIRDIDVVAQIRSEHIPKHLLKRHHVRTCANRV